MNSKSSVLSFSDTIEYWSCFEDIEILGILKSESFKSDLNWKSYGTLKFELFCEIKFSKILASVLKVIFLYKIVYCKKNLFCLFLFVSVGKIIIRSQNETLDCKRFC